MAGGAASAERAGRMRGAQGLVTLGAIFGGFVLLVVVISVVTPPAIFDSEEPTAWLCSVRESETGEVTGDLTRVNGLTAKPDAIRRIELPDGRCVDVVHTPEGLFLIEGGTVTRIDEATLGLLGQRTGEPDDVKVLADDDRTFLVRMKRGEVQQVDPDELTDQGPAVAVGDAASSAVMADDGLAWLAVPGAGAVVAVKGSPKGASERTRHELGDEDAVILLSAVGGRAVVATSDGARTLTATSKGSSIPLPGRTALDGALLSEELEGDTLWFSAKTGEVIWVDMSERNAGRVELAEGDVPCAPPMALGERAYVPVVADAGFELVVLDVESKAVLDRLGVKGDCAEVDMFVEGGLLWVNSPGQSEALVIDAAGRSFLIDKFEDEGELPGEEPPVFPPNETNGPGGEGPEDNGPGENEPGDNGPGDNGQGENEPEKGETEKCNGNPRPADCPAPEERPGRPSLSGAGQSETAVLEWTTGSGGSVTTWTVRNVDLDEELELDGGESSYEWKDLENGENYEFEVWGENEQGAGERATVRITPTDDPPAVPEGIAVQGGDRELEVSWEAAERESSGEEVDEYDVDCGGGLTENGVESLSTSLQVTAFPAEYGCRVRSVVRDGGVVLRSSWSDFSDADLVFGPPNPPVVSVSSTGGRLIVTWPKVDDGIHAPGQGTATYVVEVDGLGAPIDVGTDLTSGQIRGAQAGVAYSVSVTATNDESLESVGSAMGQVGVPGPVSLTADRVLEGPNWRVTLGWSSSDAERYSVYRNGALIASDLTDTSFVDVTDRCSTSSIYRVDAENDAGTTQSALYTAPQNSPPVHDRNYTISGVPLNNPYLEGTQPRDMWRYVAWSGGTVPYDPDGEGLSGPDLIGVPLYGSPLSSMASYHVGGTEWIKPGSNARIHIQWGVHTHTVPGTWAPVPGAPAGGFGNIHFGVLFGTSPTIDGQRRIQFDWGMSDACGSTVATTTVDGVR